MRVYTLMENQPAGPGYAAEHGLSLYVQAGGRALLVDMGQGDGFLRNAAALGVDISQVEAANPDPRPLRPRRRAGGLLRGQPAGRGI